MPEICTVGLGGKIGTLGAVVLGMTNHIASQAARTAFVEICALAGSDTVAQENAALSVGREHLPEHALKVLGKQDLTAREEREYYEWLTENVQTSIDEAAAIDTAEQDDTVTIETMPDHLRGSHRAAGNWGLYPHNGAERSDVSRDEAEEIIESDPDSYAHIVE